MCIRDSTEIAYAITIIQLCVLISRRVHANMATPAKISIISSVQSRKRERCIRYQLLMWRKTPVLLAIQRKRSIAKDASNPAQESLEMAQTALRVKARKIRNIRNPQRKIVDMPRRSSLRPLGRGELLPSGLFFASDNAPASADAYANASASAWRPAHYRNRD